MGVQDSNWRAEGLITLACVVASTAALAVYSVAVVGALRTRWAWGDQAGAAEIGAFLAILYLFFLGGLAYMVTRLGHVRRAAEEISDPGAVDAVWDGPEAPSLLLLVPSYREEIDVVWRTLLSAALQDYPNRRVMLLIDDPPDPSDGHHAWMLQRTRALPDEVEDILGPQRDRMARAASEWETRRTYGFEAEAEADRLADLYGELAQWFDALAARHPGDDGATHVFRTRVLGDRVAWARRRREAFLETLPRKRDVSREYRRLDGLFRVEVGSFERKRFAHLSHAPNKAMNLNSYLGRLGHEEPDAELISIVDADTVVTGHQAATLVHILQQPDAADVAVVQAPYQAYPRPASMLERAASANTDVMYVAHTGFTRYDAGFMIGASTIVRMRALREVAQVGEERGHRVVRFLHDRTMIEDAETSVDLIRRGWRIHNHLEPMSWSATPPDFGTLVIQRRRWANGGLILLPKFVGHVLRVARHPTALVGAVVSTQYLAVGAIVNLGMLAMLVYPFEKLPWSAWGPVAAVPYFYLYGRDLRRVGYEWADLARVYALNILLIPVVLGGSVKSLEQAITGQRAPFARTPKVPGRTAAPALYVAAVLGLLLFLAWMLGLDFARQRWVHAAFTGFNGGMLLYAAVAMMHPGAALEDLFHPVRSTARAVRDAYPGLVAPEQDSWPG